MADLTSNRKQSDDDTAPTSNWRTSAPIYAALFAPLALAVVFGGMLIAGAFETRGKDQAITALMELSSDASQLAHELQRERGMSAGFLASGGAAFSTELAAQRRQTDATIREVGASVTSYPASGLSEERAAAVEARRQRIRAGIDAITALRTRIDQQAIPSGEAAGAYTGLIRALLTISDDPIEQSAQPALTKLNMIYHDLLMAKEYGGVERATGSAGFGGGAFDLTLLRRFVDLQARQAYLLDRAVEIAGPEQRTALMAARTSAAAERVAELRSIAVSAFETGDLQGVSGPDWFAASSAWLGELKRVEELVAAQMIELATARAAEAETIAWIETALIAVIALGFGGYGLWMIRSMIASMRGVAGAIHRIAAGQDNVVVPAQDRADEIGVIARTLAATSSHGAEMQRVLAAVNGSETAILLVDGQNKRRYANEMFEKIMAERPEVAACWADDQALDWSQLVAEVDEAEKTGRRYQKSETEYALEVDVAAAIFEVKRSDVFDAEGAQIGVAIELVDVTAVRVLEREVVDMIKRVRAGDFDGQIHSIDGMGFTSVAADGLNGLVERVREFMADLDCCLSAMADGNLTKRIDQAYEGDFERARSNLNANLDRFAEMLGQIQSVAHGVSRATQPISEGGRQLAAQAESQAASMEETSATMEEMSATITANAENASRASDLSGEASTRAAKGADVVRETVSAMSRIEDSASKISDIISVIDSIAFQTNLLALNAAVEAARAGDAGKGFAVVASEVRTLAQRSADAAKDIKGLIEESAGHVSEGVRLVSQTGDSLEQIAEAVQSMTTTVADIASASREQAAGVQEVNSAISHMDQASQANSGLVEQCASSATALNQEAARLTQLVQSFQLEAAAMEHRAA